MPTLKNPINHIITPNDLKIGMHIDHTTLNNFLVVNFFKFTMHKKIKCIKVGLFIHFSDFQREELNFVKFHKSQ